VAGAAADPRLVDADNRLGLDLARRLRQDQPDANLVVSPLSAALALDMACAGAAGATRAAMAGTLGLDRLSGPPEPANAALLSALGSGDPTVRVAAANVLWARQGVPRPAFLDLNRTYYGASVGDLAEGPGAVNAWAAKATDGLIPGLLPPGSNCAAFDLLLASAVCVRGAWSAPFEPARTTAGPFTRLDASVVSCPTMRRTGLLPYVETPRAQVASLGLGRDGRWGLLLALPAPGVSLAQLAAALDPDLLRQLAAGLRPRPVDLALPRFACAWTGDLNGPLGDLGMAVAFDRSRADFSAMSAQPQVLLRVVHGARVQVDERGLQAAAGTAAGMAAAAVPSEPVQLAFDRPFLFALVDRETGVAALVGQVADPTATP
jgi:serpin B